MTTQEAYEKMRAWLTRPGATQAYNNEYGKCVYRNREDGNRCAVGGILSPAAIAEAGDVIGGVHMFVGYREGSKLVFLDTRYGKHSEPQFPHAYEELCDVETEFLRCAQQLHDDEDNWCSIGLKPSALRELDALAKQHGCVPVNEQIVLA